jgi:molecular chaperone DnaJ
MDLYILLGLSQTASLDDIKRAYKRLARRYHPDINPGDRHAAQHFRQIAEAYETLSDPARRSRYDSEGAMQSAVDASAFGFEGFDFSVRVSGNAASTFGDLFADVIEQQAAARAAAATQGADLHLTATLEFDEALRGVTRDLTVSRQVACRGCSGRGRLRTEEARCTRCHGSGQIRSARGHMLFTKPCAHCGGSGRQAEARCQACGGACVETRVEAAAVRFPPGLADGERIRIAGQGHAGRGGGAPGDLYVAVTVRPHPMFRREGDDLHVTVAIGVHEAALGAKVDVPALDGSARVRVPPGTQSGQRFRLRERGAPSPRTGQRGDLVVEVRLALPKVLDERSKALLREFGELNQGADVRGERL